MQLPNLLLVGPTALLVPFLAPAAFGQYVADNGGTPSGPGIDSRMAAMDAADIDLDGDFDLAFAAYWAPVVVGEQNRLWVNQGGLQGGFAGAFTDETDTRFPAWLASSMDIDFVDIDGDADSDVYVTSHIGTGILKGSRWWVNLGGVQGQTLGFFADQTFSRWVGLDEPGSSIDPAHLLPAGFTDYARASEFADFDADGDLDLIQASEGSSASTGGTTRIFLNDGDGRFSEFNPGGYQLTGYVLPDGAPALWAQGTQLSDTTDTTGMFADIVETPRDVQLGDIDGDFDIDILLGSVHGSPRLFENRLSDDGALGFRDVTAGRFPEDSWDSSGKDSNALGDLDGDTDLDLYGVNWSAFNDRSFRNDGQGHFESLEAPVDAGWGAEDALELVDYDSDGALDAYLSGCTGSDRLARNNGSGELSVVQLDIAKAAFVFSCATHIEALDLDLDGDPDLVVATDYEEPTIVLRNTTDVPDLQPPTVAELETLPDAEAQPVERVVRAAVVDNSPLDTVWTYEGTLDVSVAGIPIAELEMASSRGQIFRGILPGNLVGEVGYSVRSVDRQGNLGVSSVASYQSTSALPFASPFGAGTPGTAGTPNLAAASVPFAGSTLYLTASGVSEGATYFLYLTDAALPSPLPLPGLGVVNVTGNVLALLIGVAGPGDALSEALPIGPTVPAGVSVFAQLFATDGAAGNLLSSSAGLELVTQ